MKTKHLCILTGFAVALLASAAPRAAVAACDSCVSHALPTQTTYYAPTAVAQTAYYAPAPVATTAYYAPATPVYSTYYRPRWWQRWWNTPRTAYYPSTAYSTYYPSTAYAATSYYAPSAVAAPACSSCAPQVTYQPQTSYKVQIVNKPVTTMQPTTIVDGCTGCAQTVLRPVTTYVQEQQYVPTTVYRPVVSAGCETGCATACSACPTDCTGCSSCVGGEATFQSEPAIQQPNSGVPTDADQKPELRMKPLPGKETDEAGKAKNANGNTFPRLTDPNDRTAQHSTPSVRRVSWSQATPKQSFAYRQVSDNVHPAAK